MNQITEFAPAKINLSLQVTGRREDGYHLLQSLVAFADIGDEIRIRPAKTISLRVSGPFAEDLDGHEVENNLVYKAAKLLATQTGSTAGAQIELVKNLPVASGIGGGSADAAATIRALLKLWDIDNIPEGELTSLALKLGADVPVCIMGQCSWMEGIGETVSPGPLLPELYVVLVNPGKAVSTPQIFKALDGQFSKIEISRQAASSNLIKYLSNSGNDLEAPARSLVPVIASCVNALSSSANNLFAAMSGSGATCFGLYASPLDAKNAAKEIVQENLDWWVKPAKLM